MATENELPSFLPYTYPPLPGGPTHTIGLLFALFLSFKLWLVFAMLAMVVPITSHVMYYPRCTDVCCTFALSASGSPSFILILLYLSLVTLD